MSKLKVSAIHDPDNDNEAITVDTSGNVGVSSNLKVNTIQDTTGNDALTIDSSGNVTASQGFVPSTQLSHRNLIINGAMQVAQRGTSWTSPTGEYTIDRCEFGNSSFGAWDVTQSTDAPAGFKYSAKATCTTADASPASGDYVFLRHNLEGHNIAHLNYGSSNAKELTLSFWVKSNKTGTFGIETQTATSYERTADVTINASDTWEYKTVLIPANTAYSTNEDNNLGMRIYFWLNAGSSYKGTPTTTWGTGHSGRGGTLTAGIGGAVNDYFAITGVQLEVGSVATPFEHRSYGEELALCQRYLCVVGSYEWICVGDGTNTGVIVGLYKFPVTMRATPSCNSFSFDNINGNWGYSGRTVGDATPRGLTKVNYTTASLLPSDQMGWNTNIIYADAEL